jgi:isocitrate dehydrogenase kinase/phosphatase
MKAEHKIVPERRSRTGDVPLVIARIILEGFNTHYGMFRDVSRQAKSHFENGDWQWLQDAVRERIDYYDRYVLRATERLHSEFNVHQLKSTDWQQIKQHYTALLTDHKQPECAETFFNSVCCKILHRDYFRNDFIYVRPGVATDYMDSETPSFRSYYPLRVGLSTCVRQLLQDSELACPFVDLERDARRLIRAMRAYLPRPTRIEPDCQIQVLGSLFFRNKGAYVVGKFVNGNRPYPFAIPILRNSKGELYVDTLLFDPDQLAVLFSFSRAYFLVDMEAPAAYITFLHSMMPHKPLAELYSLVGLQKQGKTLFYRDLLHHLRHSSDKFVIAPGTKGLVMVVFTLPSYPYVFKVIRDSISYPKKITRSGVKEKYLLVKQHDRVGRMVDVWEYSQVALPKARFTAEVLEELHALAPSVLEDEGETIVIGHVYIERRVKPLDLVLQHRAAETFDHAVIEYGNAIKDIASANIFPGDLLFKNFGVTRLGRVVFYDYDEVCYLTECHFRQIPEAETPEDELAAEPWFSVDPNDVFPEEFATFLLGDPRVREVFMKHHADLLDPEVWQAKQDRLRSGSVEDVFPYPLSIRFRNLFATERGPLPDLSAMSMHYK